MIVLEMEKGTAVIDLADGRDGRFERHESGHAVFALYRRSEGELLIEHVEAAPALRGTGASDRLMCEIVDLARRDDLKITATCGWAALWLRRHPQISGEGSTPSSLRNGSA